MHNNNQEMKYLYMPDHTPHRKEQKEMEKKALGNSATYTELN